MNLYNVTNIKSLPNVEQVLNGDFLIIENPTGTSKIDFKDFVIGPNNTSFYVPLATDVLTLSSKVDILSSTNINFFNTISTSNASFYKTTITSISSLCDKVKSFESFLYTYNIFNEDLNATIGVNATTGTAVFITSGVNISKSNVKVQFERFSGVVTDPASGANIDYCYYIVKDAASSFTTNTVYVSTGMFTHAIRTFSVNINKNSKYPL